MKQHSIILHSSEAKAILAGRQSQIRVAAWTFDKQEHIRKPGRYQHLKPGDLIWVKETFIEYEGWRRGAGKYGMAYGSLGCGARAPEHMRGVECKIHHRRPEDLTRAMSRLTLEVNAARIETLGNISEADIRAQGIIGTMNGALCGYAHAEEPIRGWEQVPRQAFASFWNIVHGRESFRPDTEVVAIAFAAHALSINKLLEQRNGDSGALTAAAEALR